MNKKLTRFPKNSYPKFVRKFFVGVLLLVCMFTPLSVAKYVTNFENVQSARVAAFNVSASSSENKYLSIKLANDQTTATYTFAVINNSEVYLEYDIILTFNEAVPSGVTFNINSSSYTSTSGNEYTFANRKLNIGSTANLTLTFEIDETLFNSYVLSSGITEKLLSGIQIKVNARQAIS